MLAIYPSLIHKDGLLVISQLLTDVTREEERGRVEALSPWGYLLISLYFRFCAYRLLKIDLV